MDIDIKGQREVKYATSADSTTADTASTDTASADTASADTAADYIATTDTAADEPSRKSMIGGRDVGGEMGRCRRERRRQRLETNICVPNLQVPTRNKCKSYYYFNTTYCCSIYFYGLSFQTSNFAAPPIAFYFSNCNLKCVVL